MSDDSQHRILKDDGPDDIDELSEIYLDASAAPRTVRIDTSSLSPEPPPPPPVPPPLDPLLTPPPPPEETKVAAVPSETRTVPIDSLSGRVLDPRDKTEVTPRPGPPPPPAWADKGTPSDTGLALDHEPSWKPNLAAATAPPSPPAPPGAPSASLETEDLPTMALTPDPTQEPARPQAPAPDIGAGRSARAVPPSSMPPPVLAPSRPRPIALMRSPEEESPEPVEELPRVGAEQLSLLTAARAAIERKQPLGRRDYIAFMAIAGVVLAAFNWELAQAADALRGAGRARPLALLYVVWLVGDVVAFAFTSRWTVRRWMDACGVAGLPLLGRALVRAALLSPLLSILAVGMSAALPRRFFVARSYVPDGGVGGAAGRLAAAEPSSFGARLGVLPTLGLALAAFHLLFMANVWSSARKAARTAAALNMPAPAEASPLARYALPYLPLSSRYALRVADDLARLTAIREMASEGSAPTCRRRPVRLGQIVDDCFFQEALNQAKAEPFAASGLIAAYEMQYRAERAAKRTIAANQDPRGAMPAQMASVYAGLENAINALQVPEDAGLAPARERLAPWSWPLAIVGSPEPPLLNALLDGQRAYAIRQLTPVFEAALDQLPSALEQARLLVSAHDRDAFAAKRVELINRVQALRERPLSALRERP